MTPSLLLPESYKYIGAFLTMRCNLNCSFCLNAFDKAFKRKRNELSGMEWVESLNRVESRAEVPVTFSGGEPFLHEDFLYIIKNLRRDLNIDILTNLYPGSSSHRKKIEAFANEIDPNRMKRDSPYPSIRVSYHPEQMEPSKLIEMVKLLQQRGFNIGIYSVLYPSPKTLEAITQMQFLCKNEGVEFRVKDFTGVYQELDDNGKPFSITHGNYSKYPGAAFKDTTKKCFCKTSELLLAPDGGVYRCHRDLFAEDSPIGYINQPNFEIKDEFRACSNYGDCHPCDVKVKTNNEQKPGHTSVEIKDIS